MNRLIFFAAFVVIVQNFYGQETTMTSINTSGFIISIGPSFPMGDFGEDSVDYDYQYPFDNRSLAAGTGIALNFDYVLPLWNNGIGMFVGAGINYNGVKKGYKKDFENEHLTEFGIEAKDISYQKHINIPLSTGLNYTFNFNEKFGFFGNIGIVANILKISDQDVVFQVGEHTRTYDASKRIGLRIGGGLIFNNRFYLSLNYLDVGKTEIKYEGEFISDEPIYEFIHKYSTESKISYLNLTLGIKL